MNNQAHGLTPLPEIATVLVGAFCALETIVNVELNILAELGAKMIRMNVFCCPVTSIDNGPVIVNSGSPLKVAEVINKSLKPPL